MPLYVTVTPGTTVTSSTVLDPSVLNLLGNPAIDINGTVDGGSLSLAAGSVTTSALADDAVTFPKFQNIGTDRLLGRDTAGVGDVEELTVSGGLGFTGSGGIEISNGQVAYAKIVPVAASRLLGNPTGSSATMSEIPLGTGLAFQEGALVNTVAAKYRADFQFSRGDAPSSLSIPASSNTTVTYWPFTYDNDDNLFTQFQTSFVPTNYQITMTSTIDITSETPVGLTLQYSTNLSSWENIYSWDLRGTAGYRSTSGAVSITGSPANVYYRLVKYNPSEPLAVNLGALGLTLSVWN
jgi:hypothetical protein